MAQLRQDQVVSQRRDVVEAHDVPPSRATIVLRSAAGYRLERAELSGKGSVRGQRATAIGGRAIILGAVALDERMHVVRCRDQHRSLGYVGLCWTEVR